jgi:protein tyrosine phosphatase (PTP) superfamily phosphohydrolase (DUF442 family)
MADHPSQRPAPAREADGTGFSSPAARRSALAHYHLVDHGILRTLWPNLHRVAPGVWRANQPSPARLAQFRARGIRAILNLRGSKGLSHFQLEREACARLGLTLVNVPLSAAPPAARETLLALHEVFLTIPKPFVMHCKSGADRTGIAAALYLLTVADAPLAEAARQLHWRFLHLPRGEAGVLDHMLATYGRARAESGIGALDWIRTAYDPAAIVRDYYGRKGQDPGRRAEPRPPAAARWFPPPCGPA